MRKIGIVSSADRLGGTELSSMRICRILNENGENVVYIAPGTMIADELNTNGIKLKKCSMNRRNPFLIFKSVLSLKKIVEEEKINILHCQDAWSAIIASYAKKMLKERVKVIWHLRGISFNNYTRMAKFRKELDVTVCNSYNERELLLLNDYEPEKAIVIYNAIEKPVYTKTRDQIRKELGFSENDYVIGGVGRLVPLKGFQYLIKAISAINDPQIKLLIVGDGWFRPELEKLAKEMHVDSKVVFTGYRRDTADLYHAMDLFGFCSYIEPFGNIGVEAMLSRVPVLASYTGGIPEIVTEGKTGFFAKPAVLDDWVKKIKFMKNQKDNLKDIIDSAYEEASEKYSFERFYSEIKEVYDSLYEGC